MNARLLARIAECDRLEAGQGAEGQGLRAAARFETCHFPYSTDLYLQQRFEQGFRDGKALLTIRMEVAHADATHGAGVTVADAGRGNGESDDSAIRTDAQAQPPSPCGEYPDW
ncbi:MAG: hypothetical protein Q8S75_04155 [Nitrospirota bacterium]|nr:hypothetical protein [Nitrospirota bacterium]